MPTQQPWILQLKEEFRIWYSIISIEELVTNTRLNRYIETVESQINAQVNKAHTHGT